MSDDGASDQRSSAALARWIHVLDDHTHQLLPQLRDLLETPHAHALDDDTRQTLLQTLGLLETHQDVEAMRQIVPLLDALHVPARDEHTRQALLQTFGLLETLQSPDDRPRLVDQQSKRKRRSAKEILDLYYRRREKHPDLELSAFLRSIGAKRRENYIRKAKVDYDRKHGYRE